MNRVQAVDLVKELFTNPFDKDCFARLTGELLHTLEPAPFSQRGQMVWESFRQHVSSFDRIGKYQTPDGRRIDVLTVKLKADTSLERARTLQRNLIAKYLKDGRGGQWKDAALVAFHVENNPDWRFSLVSLETRLAAVGKIKEELSPARRLSFLVGKNESSHTAQMRLLPLLLDGSPAPNLDRLQTAFDIEVVTKEFFGKYRELFERLKTSLDLLIKDNPSARREFDAKKIEIAEFSKKLLGQIVFLYFLQKKGWFGVARNAEWGTGPKNFLRDLFDKKYVDYQNFFNDILEPLFYEALAKERDRHYYSPFKCRIPFLNGGLFDAIGDYSWEDVDLFIPDSVFSNDTITPEEDKGDGILDIFDRYNFTVCEDEPLEKEVAVDPEMLGKVFENLLDEDGRHATGTYYTPRDVVHHMCRKSLLEYLTGKAPEVPRADLDLFLRHGDALEEHEATVIEKGKETDTYSHKLSEPLRRNAAKLDTALKNLLVCDPAIGSGAFPLGMMAEIVRARRLLAKLNKMDGQPGHTPYDFKRHAIQHTLHGVDLAPGAVEIAKLRLWLSLVVDEDDIHTIKPLPNLDYKIMQGNSLLETVEGVRLIENLWGDVARTTEDMNEPARKTLRAEILTLTTGRMTGEKKARLKEISRKLEKMDGPSKVKTDHDQRALDFDSTGRHNKADELKRLQNEFFGETSKAKKNELKRRIEDLEWEVVETALRGEGKNEALKRLKADRTENIRRYFLWHLHFADVFQENDGFDIVIGNPPYVRQEEIKELKPALEAEGYRTFSGTADLYVYFFERGIKLLRDGGTLAFITSNKYFRAAYGEKLRAYLGENASIKEIVDFGDAGKVFEAIAYPSIVVAVKTEPTPEAATVRALVWQREARLDQVDQEVEGKSSLLLTQKTLTPEGWRFLMSSEAKLLDKLRAGGQPLGEYVKGRFYRGILTGLNEAFVVDRATRDRLMKEDPSSKELLKPFLRGRDVKRWRVEPQDLWLIFTRRGTDIKKYPAILEHLRPFRKQLEPGGPDGRKPGPYQWFEIQDNIAYWQEFEQPKIVYQEIATYQAFGWDGEGYYANNKVFILPGADHLLLGLLNSGLTWWFLGHVVAKLQGDAYALQAPYVEQVPVPVVNGKTKTDLEIVVTRILKLKKDNSAAIVSALEDDLNGQIYRLFGLTKDEIGLLQEHV